LINFSQVSPSQPRVCVSLDPSLALKGDVLIKCFHKRPRSNIRDVIFRCQFHTCAVSNHAMMLHKADLDDAAEGERNNTLPTND
jgi:tensin